MRISLQSITVLSFNSIVAFLLGSLLFFIPNDIYADVLWSTNHETGNLSDWHIGQSGAVYNTGIADVSVTGQVAHSGQYAVKMEVWGMDREKTACRIFRWAEHLKEGYYSCWYMFPTLPTVNGWLNIFQFKKKDWSNGQVDPTWYLEVKNRSRGTLLTLTHWEKEWDIAPNVNPSPVLSANEWFHVECYYKDGRTDGELRIWINGSEIWSLSKIDTRGIDPDIQWAPSLYGENVSPGNLILYMDDAVISTERVGPNYFSDQSIPSPPQSLRIIAGM